VWAPVLLVAMRVVQGLGAGAEYGGAVIYLVENAPAKHRGFWGGFAPLGVSVGNLLAAGAFALVTMLPREDLLSWGWRLPFLASRVASRAGGPGAGGPRRQARGLLVRRARRPRFALPVLLEGRRRALSLDRARLRPREAWGGASNVRAAGGVFRRGVPAATPL